MNIGLIGYGKMGKIVEVMAFERGHSVTEIYDINTPLNDSSSLASDCYIDFSIGTEIKNTLSILHSQSKNLVCGTTQWNIHLEDAQQLYPFSESGILSAGNFSIGIHVLTAALESAVKILGKNPEFDYFIEERHHKHKIDAPSGTALMLAKSILNNTYKNDWKLSVNEKNQSETLSISSTRSGSIFGEHTIGIDSFSDTITLSHQAKNRDGFALGALMSAEWLVGKTGWYNFGAQLESILNLNKEKE